MQFELPFWRKPASVSEEHWLQVGAQRVRLWLVRNRHARRYILRLRPDGAARLTIPRGGSIGEALRFAAKNVSWLERQLLRQPSRPQEPKPWLAGEHVLLRGERVRLEPGRDGEAGLIRFGTEALRVQDAAADLRPAVEAHLRDLAAHELPARVSELAAEHQVPVQRIAVRNQRSRWGSFSRRGTLSLNWRLIQAPAFVRDYIVLHELAHFKEMNHSRRFWAEVTRFCPDFARAESWLKEHACLLR